MSDRRLSRGFWFIAAAVAASLLPVGGLYFVWFDEPAWPPPAREDAAADVRIGLPLTVRLLIVIHDSLNRAAGEDPEVTPFLAEAGAHGVRGVLTVPGPTLTGISLTAFGTGVTPPLRAAFTNFRLDRWLDEDFVGLVRLRHDWLATAYFGDVTWSRLFGRATFEESTYLSDSLVVEWKDGLTVKDRESMAAALAAASSPKWSLMVVHLTSTDKLAHNHHGRPREADGNLSEYGMGAFLQDGFARRLWRASGGGDLTTIFLLSDHGCTPSGTHGSFDAVTRETPWAAAGPGLRRDGRRINIDATALAPMWCRILGVRGPRRAESAVPVEALEIDAGEAVRTLELNLEARRTAARGFLERFGAPDVEARDEESARIGAWTDLDQDRPEAVAVRLRAAHEHVRSAVADSIAVRRRSRLAAGMAGAAASALFLLTWSFRDGRRSRARCFGAAALVFGGLWLAEVGRDFWVYAVMNFAAGSWGVLGDVPRALPSAAVFGIGWMLGRWRRMRRKAAAVAGPPEVWSLPAAAVFLVIGGHLAVAWPYGPKVETAFALLFGVSGFLTGSMIDRMPPIGRPARLWSLAAGLAAFAMLEWSSGRWITPEIESVFRIPDGPGLRCVALVAVVVFAVWPFIRAPVRPERRGFAGAAFGLVLYGLSDVAHASGLVTFAAAACVTFLAGLLWSILKKDQGGDRVHELSLLGLGLYRLLVVDANLLLALLFVVGARLVFNSFRPLAPAAAAVLAVILEWVFWLAQGYAYKITAFDPAPAFLLIRDRFDPVAGIPFPVLQHLVPWIWVVGPAAAAAGGGGGSRPLLRMAEAAALAFALRSLLTLLAIPWFEGEAWYFLTASHYLVFEAGRGILVVMAILLVAATCRHHGGVRVGTA